MITLDVGIGEGLDEFGVVEGLYDEVGGPFLQACDGQFDVGVGGEEHHLGVGLQPFDLAQPVEPLIACVDAGAEVHIEQHHVGMLLTERGGDGVRIGQHIDIGKGVFQ